MKPPFWLLLAACVLILFAIWSVTRQGSGHVTLAWPVAGSTIYFNATAVGARAVACLLATAAAGILFLAGLVSGLVEQAGHGGRGAAEGAAPQP